MPEPITKGVSIRLLSPLANYPLGEFRNPEAAIVVKPDLIVMVTTFAAVETPDDYVSETELLSPFEVRLLATILLSRCIDSERFNLYPTESELRRPYTGVDLSDSTTINELFDEFKAFLHGEPPYLDIHRPPLLGGRSYHFAEDSRLEHGRHATIFGSIEVTDHLMIRGLGALIKANMLGLFWEFTENACMSLWIAMEASLKILQRKLREAGVKDPSPHDAGHYLDTAFESQSASGGYFVDFYEDRVKTIHPASRFGVYPAAPLAADDFYELRGQLWPLYDFLLTGFVPQELKGTHDSW